MPRAAVEIAQELHHQVDLGGAQAGHHLVEQQERAGRVASARATSSRLRSGSVSDAAGWPRLANRPSRSSTSSARLRASPTLRRALSAPTTTLSSTRQPRERLDQLEGAPDPGAADLVRPPAVDAPAGEAHEPGVRPVDARRSC